LFLASSEANIQEEIMKILRRLIALNQMDQPFNCTIRNIMTAGWLKIIRKKKWTHPIVLFRSFVKRQYVKQN